MLNRAKTWKLLATWAVVFGLATWGLEAILLQVVSGAPSEPWSGVFRLVQVVIWVGIVVVAIAVAERWPIENVRRQWRRVASQFALGVALGPVCGTIAYLFSESLMPWWLPRGMWGIIATEAKGVLFGYVTTAILAHGVLRALRQRAQEVAVAESVRRATEARLNLLKLELQPETVLRAMTAVEDLIPRDVNAANESLVLLAETLRGVVASARIHLVPLREELAITESFVRLRELTGDTRIQLVVDAKGEVLEAVVPHLLLHPVVEALLDADGNRPSGRHRVSVGAERAGRHLVIRVVAGGSDRWEPQRVATAVGVAHTRERLSHLFGSDQAFTLVPAERTASLEVEIRVPYEEAVLPALPPAKP